MNGTLDGIKGMERLTINAKRLIMDGYSIAEQYNSPDYLAIHIFYALINEKNTIVAEIFEKLGVDIETTKARILDKLQSGTLREIDNQSHVDVKPTFSSQIKDLLKKSFEIALELDHVYVGTEHLLLSLFQIQDIDFIEDVKKVGITFDLLKSTLLSLGSYPLPTTTPRVDIMPDLEEMETSSLPYFCTDLTQKAIEGKLPNITGRDNEIKRLIHILSRKTKNNPILVGEAGVGKTAIIEGFANMLAKKTVPASFIEKKIMNLDIASILAGARLRGDVEERINNVIKDAIEDGNTFLFIDEVHTIVGAGSAGSKDSMDIANILKPYLTSSELSIIGATTYEEYQKYFESDSALTRRFQPIYVDEIDNESAKGILKVLKPEFETYHKVKITNEAIDDAVDLSSKFIQDRYLPDKAIDVLDEAAASIKVGREIAIEPELNSLGEKLIKVQEKKDLSLNSADFEQASKYKDEEESIIKEISSVMEGNKNSKNSKFSKTVTSDLIKQVILEWTKIPIVASDISDKRLKNLDKKLKDKIIGQDKVVENVSLAIQRSHLGLNDENRPLASFLFLGPTGVGKTELAKELAAEVFGSKDLIFQINMSEFMEVHSISKMIGSPPGYVGHDEGGQLTDFVRKKPYSVVLFDEIEKAHLDTLNLLLQILEEGTLTDAKGRKISFKNCIIIMTSNIGAEKISHDRNLGFDVELENVEDKAFESAYKEMEGKILEELSFSLRPEFLNRIDSVNVFRGLGKEDSFKITRLRVQDLIKRLIGRGIVLSVDDEVVKKINEEGYSKEFGGRNIRRKVQEILEDGLAKFLLNSKFRLKKHHMLRVSANLEKGFVTFEITE